MTKNTCSNITYAPVRKAPLHLLVVDLEPAPYKVDLWNAFAASTHWQIEVLYTNAKDISKDAGHNYQELPKSHFKFHVLPGHSFWSSVSKIGKTFGAIFRKEVDLVFISGYVHAAPLAAILICTILQKPFCVHSDIFNLQDPKGRIAKFKRFIRDQIRVIIFRYAKGVLVCGKLGINSAQLAGCPPFKIVDFPYVVDVKRILSDPMVTIPQDLEDSLQDSKIKLYFSGRMIERKGLGTLLEALAKIDRAPIQNRPNWSIWISGDGPLLDSYHELAGLLGISHRVRFLGFMQMSMHSWLLQNADIVIVPSLSDAWGIVVDEAMQLGKTVIASSSVGSAIDRIEAGENGELFTPSNIDQLCESLERCIQSSVVREKLGRNALITAKTFGPERNVNNLTRLINQSI